MFNRKEIKARGKIAFKANYWMCVLVALISSIIGGELTSNISSRSGFDYGFNHGVEHSLNQGLEHSFNNMTGGTELLRSVAVSGFLMTFIMIIAIGGIALSIFAFNPLKVGCANFFMLNRNDNTTGLENLAVGFNRNYSNVVKVTFLRSLFIFLWSLLFIIPGIIKSYDYRLVDYLLSRNPDMDYKEALDTSRNLMYGNRWNVFVLDLSFIGWKILSALTLGILGIFYVSPYVEATNADLFWTLAFPESGDSFNYELAQDESQTVEFETK